MEWIKDNWPLILMGVLFIILFYFSHRIRRIYDIRKYSLGNEDTEDEDVSATKTENSTHRCCH